MKYTKLPVSIEAITFDELVQHAIASGVPLVDGIPWSFEYKGQPITHETDDCYIIPTLEGAMKMTRGDMLITGVKGEIYPCRKDIFDKTYAVTAQLPEKVVPKDIVDNIKDVKYFTAENGIRGASLAEGRGGYDACVDLRMCLLTFCVITMKNGFVVTGESACVSVEAFDKVTGENIAYENAIDKMWPLLGYNLRQRHYEAAQIAKYNEENKNA